MLAQGSEVQSQRVSKKLTRTVALQPLLWSRTNNAASSLCEDKHEYTEHYHLNKKLCDKMRKINFQIRESYVFSQHYFVSLT